MKLRDLLTLQAVSPVVGGTTLQYAHLEVIPTSAQKTMYQRGKIKTTPADDPNETSDKFFDKLKRDAQFPTKKRKGKTLRDRLAAFEESKNPLAYRMRLARRNATPPSLPAETTSVLHHTSPGIYGGGPGSGRRPYGLSAKTPPHQAQKLFEANTVVDLLKKNGVTAKVVGSVAKGTSRPDSDIDLRVRPAGREDRKNFRHYDHEKQFIWPMKKLGYQWAGDTEHGETWHHPHTKQTLDFFWEKGL